MGKNIWVQIHHYRSFTALKEAVLIGFKPSLEVKHYTFFEVTKEYFYDKINLSMTQTLAVV